MRTGGILLIASGGVLIYWVLRAGLKSARSSSGSSSSSGDGGGGNNSGSSGGTDSGSHMAIDTSGTMTGTLGAVYTVNKTYGASTDQERGDENAFAHASGG